MKSILGIPGEPLEPPGTSGDPAGTPLGPPGDGLVPPGDAPRTPWDHPGNLKDHKNGHILKNVQRWKLSIAASEVFHCNASQEGLLGTVLCCMCQDWSPFRAATGLAQGSPKVSGGGRRPMKQGVCP